VILEGKGGMGSERPAAPAAFFCALTTAGEAPRASALAALAARLGPEADRLPPFPFTFTHYYEREMGRGLEKMLVLFATLRPPGDLVELKRATNVLEAQLARADGGREVNLDPGYVTPAKVVLATTKDFSHRVCLGGGIYGEVTLKASGGAWEPLPWTYPDYRTDSVRQFLWRARDLVLRAAPRREG